MVLPRESDGELRPPQRLWSFNVDLANLSCIRPLLFVALGFLAASDDEVDLPFGVLEYAIRVAFFRRRRRRRLLLTVGIVIRSTLASHIVPRIRYLGFTTQGKKSPLTTTGDLSACKST
jgi:hypothetical protein